MHNSSLTSVCDMPILHSICYFGEEDVEGLQSTDVAMHLKALLKKCKRFHDFKVNPSMFDNSNNKTIFEK